MATNLGKPVRLRNDGGSPLELQTGANVAAIGAPANGVISVGSGIRFPATQVASANANTLDDYEEGTFTPAWSFATSGSVTLSSASGSYVKVGRVVYLDVFLQTSAISSPTGAATLTGLPFSGDFGGAVAKAELRRWATSMPELSGVAFGTTIVFRKNAINAANYSNLEGSDFGSAANNNTMVLSLFYFV